MASRLNASATLRGAALRDARARRDSGTDTATCQAEAACQAPGCKASRSAQEAASRLAQEAAAPRLGANRPTPVRLRA